jgi:hypothetical protein
MKLVSFMHHSLFVMSNLTGNRQNFIRISYNVGLYFFFNNDYVSRLCNVNGRMMNEYRAVSGMVIGRGNQSTQKRTCPSDACVTDQ